MWDWILQNAVELIGHLLTLIGIIVGAIIVSWQLSRQNRDSLKLQRNNAKEALKLDIYKTLDERIRILSHSNVTAAMYAFMIPYKLENHQYLVQNNLPAQPLTERALEFLRLNNEAGNSVIKLIEEFETWVIALPELELFQTAINSANHDAREAFLPLFTALVKVLPVDPPDSAPTNIPRPIVKPPISEKELNELKELVHGYKNAMDDIGSYIFDLKVEAQNNLLSELFDHRVPKRQPLDPKLKVLSTDPNEVKNLMKYFLEETAWGKEKLKFDKEFEESQKT